MAKIDMSHQFSHEIVGLGNKIIIPNLSRDSNYDMPVFEKSGFSSLIAVPIMTYRVYGILGMGYRARKKFNKDFSKLTAVIAGLIGMSLHKIMLSIKQKEQPRKLGSSNAQEMEYYAESYSNHRNAVESEDIIDNRTQHQSNTDKQRGIFREHARQMTIFNKSHKQG